MPRDWERARRAYFPVEKVDIMAFDFTEAVAPVKIKVGGWAASVALRRSGRAAWEKRNAPVLFVAHISSNQHTPNALHPSSGWTNGRTEKNAEQCTYMLTSLLPVNSCTLVSRNGFRLNPPLALKTAAAHPAPGNSFSTFSIAFFTLASSETSVEMPRAFPPELLISVTRGE